jgi:hypothetical protein
MDPLEDEYIRCDHCNGEFDDGMICPITGRRHDPFRWEWLVAGMMIAIFLVFIVGKVGGLW